MRSEEPGPRALRMIEDWAYAMRRHLHADGPDRRRVFFGVGNHGHWAMQAQATAASAFAVLSADPGTDSRRAGMSRDELCATALGMVRFLWEGHAAGGSACTDEVAWGHSWISALCLERLAHGIDALGKDLPDADRDGWARVMVSESDWLMDQYRRRKDAPPGAITAGLSTDNHPENNIWNGALLYRTSRMVPDAPRAEAYADKAVRFLLNGISIPADAQADTPFAGEPLSAWHVGPNFHPTFALNHHGYLNVGYMNICLSNIAMLHFTCRLRGWPPPDGLYLHAADLWQRVKTFTFPDGRLARIGGDTRVRYCYCQDYALPTWLWARDRLRDEDAARFIDGWLGLVEREQRANPDGSFLGRRLRRLEDVSPLYYTRLEGDRAATLSMAVFWHRVLAGFRDAPTETEPAPEPLRAWSDETHGAVFTRGPHRLASWTWVGGEGPTGLCVPPAASDMAEWRMNLAGRIRGHGQINLARPEAYRTWSFDGGFCTCGRATIATDTFIGEGDSPDDVARLDLAFAALPDGQTVLGFQRARTPHRVRLTEVKGLSLLLPNDLFNGSVRRYRGEKLDAWRVSRPGAAEQTAVGGWLNIDDTLGVLALHGGELVLVRPAEAQIGIHAKSGQAQRLWAGGMLYADEICLGAASACPADYPGGAVLFDIGYALRSGVDTAATRTWSRQRRPADVPVTTAPDMRTAMLPGADGARYLAAVNFGEAPADLRLGSGVRMENLFAGNAPSQEPDGSPSFRLASGDMLVIRVSA